MAGGGLLGIGSSGLLAFQRSLNTIGQNIANVNTEGYSRQSTVLSSRAPHPGGFGFSGTGVDTVTIRRSFDAFVEANVRNGVSSSTEYKTFNDLAVQLDNVIADPNAGMSGALQRFFNAIQDVSDSPSSPAARQVLYNEAGQLSNQFNELARYIEDTRGQLNNSLDNSVNEVNRIIANIAKMNTSVVTAMGASGGQPPNDLLDQRDKLIRDLSEYVNVSTLEQDDGAINVFIGKGQLLVRGSEAGTLTTYTKDGQPDVLGIAIRSGTSADIPVTEQLIGGRIGGVLGFRDRMLDPASNSLGRVAIGLGTLINEQNQRGMDLDGLLGADFFTTGQPETFVEQGAAGNIDVAFNDVTQLTKLDYRLRFDAGNWTLTRTDTNQAVTMNGSGTAADPFVADGIEITVNVAPANGDTYVIHPTRRGALDMRMVMADSRQIGAAAPVRTRTASANTGTGVISDGVVTDIGNAAFQNAAGQLSPPLMIRFTAGNLYDIYDNSNPAAPVLLESAIPYSGVNGSDVFPTPGGLDFGYQLRLSGAPQSGDEFFSEYNTGGIGDNRNVNLMADLFLSKSLNGGTASFTDSYNGLVADIGTGTRQSGLNAETRSRLLDQTLATREAISGVNLDDEAANLVRFQQAYQAAAQVIATASTLFDTVLAAVRR